MYTVSKGFCFVFWQHGYKVIDPDDETDSNAGSESGDHLMEVQQDNQETDQNQQVTKKALSPIVELTFTT